MTASAAMFFYGTLRASEVRRAVLGADFPSEHLTKAILAGYEVRRVEGALYPMLVASAGGQVNGVMVTDVDKSCLNKLDRFEGVHYRRASLEVTTENGMQAAEVYLPDHHMTAAELWLFDSWYKHDMSSFLEQDFNLDGVRAPTG